jgi:cellulose biosynthesis protein BcsQ
MSEPQIIAVVSGKGGVGKTMLSVAIANELARAKKTLLLDLDFFNRGLTGLFASSKMKSRTKSIQAPSFFGTGEMDWSVGEVERNLFMIFYSDLDKSQSDILETRDIASLASELGKFVHYLIEIVGCEFVVLDCHGGPDNTSFAACSIASRSILVSEPDRITLHGTLNFLRFLKRQTDNGLLDIRLVFNKVVAAFTSIFLFSFYNRYLRKEFGNRDLLAIYPLEVYLTKAFEKMPFLTTVYPKSQLAVKTRLVLFELFQDESKSVLPPQIAGMTKFERMKAKYYLGRRPKLLDLDFVLKAIAVYALVVFGIPLSLLTLPGEYPVVKSLTEFFSPLQIAMSAAIPWILLVLLVEWTIELDTVMTYSFRTRGFVRSIIAALLLIVIWLPSAILLGALLHELNPLRLSMAGFWRLAQIGGFLGVLFPLVISLAFYAKRGIRNIRFDGRYVEGMFRIIFSTGLLVILLKYAVSGV